MPKPAEDRTARRKDQAVADRPPKDGDQARNPDALGQDGEDVLAADKAAVEEGKARKGHEQDKRRARHHPGVVARSRPGNLRGDAGRPGGVVHIGLQVGDPLLERRVGRLGISGHAPGSGRHAA